MRLYLGTHMVGWLARPDMPPLFVSHRRLASRKTLPRAAGPWALDSGGFTELSMYGAWTVTPERYAAAVRRYRDEIGHLEWAAPQDWMCEPFMLAKTGLGVFEHQARTVRNYLALREIAPDLPFVPVLQGWDLADYERCADAYDQAGVDLSTERTVGLGSVCRRQHTGQIETIAATLALRGLRLHGFGVKTRGLGRYADFLVSADSLAWSYRARREANSGERRPEACRHRSCANCHAYARRWHAQLVEALNARPVTLYAMTEGAA